MRKNKENLILNKKDQYFAFYKNGDDYQLTINHIPREQIVYILEDIKYKMITGQIQLEPQPQPEGVDKGTSEDVIKEIQRNIEERKSVEGKRVEIPTKEVIVDKRAKVRVRRG